MTPEPLDPCPVCGKPCTPADSDYGTMCTECDYNVYDDIQHRRLCAEVALARALEPEVEQFATSHRLSGHAAEADEWLRLVARVREASK